MYTLKALLLICSVPFTLGQYGNPSPQSSTSSSAASAASASPAAGVQVVTVGQNGLTFSPDSLTASVGSFVEFHFFPPTHSVAQSSFSTPCAPPSNGTGFWSGLIQSSGGQNSNVFRITINDTNPIWFYCAFPTHCQSGMSGVINPPTDPNQSLADYMAAAAKTSSSVEPPTVQGGVIGAADVASTTATGPSTASSTAKSGAESIWSTLARPWVLFLLVLGWLLLFR